MQFRAIIPIIFSAFLFLAGCATLDSAIVQGNIAQVKKIISKDKSKIYSTDDLEETPLHRAVKWGHLEIVEYLVSAGANINAKDKYGDTPLHDAIQYGDDEKREKIIRYSYENHSWKSTGEKTFKLYRNFFNL